MKKIKSFYNLIMFTNNIYVLAFGLIAAIFASGGMPPVRTFILIFIALLAARIGANAFNRIADKDIDKRNPRTVDRDIPAGRIKLFEAYALTVICFIIMVIASYYLNMLCFALSPIAICACLLYSYTKRFTWLCHFIMGFVYGGAPVGAWLAVTGEIAWLPFVLGAATMFWLAGIDIVYATQDINFDKNNNLFSIPSKYGFKTACFISALSHAIFFVLLAILPFMVRELGWLYFSGLAVIGILLAMQHYKVEPGNVKKMKLISFDLNKIVGAVFLAVAWVDFMY